MALNQRPDPEDRYKLNPFGGVGGDPNDIENKSTPFNPGQWARVGGNPNDTTKPYLYDANGNHVIVPYGGSGMGVNPGSGTSGSTPAATTGATTTTGAATGTGAGILGSSLKWADIINAALAIYGLKKADQTPNFYQVPPTPGEQWRTDTTKNLYGYASAYTDQFLKGLNGLNPSFQMPNNLTGNPAFMGGVKVPTVDFSKVPPINGTTAPSATNQSAPPIPPGITPERVKVGPDGKWTIDNPTPEEQQWLDLANRAKTGSAP